MGFKVGSYLKAHFVSARYKSIFFKLYNELTQLIVLESLTIIGCTVNTI